MGGVRGGGEQGRKESWLMTTEIFLMLPCPALLFLFSHILQYNYKKLIIIITLLNDLKFQ